MKGFMFLILSVCAIVFVTLKMHDKEVESVRNVLSSSYNVTDIKEGWHISSWQRHATKSVVCVHGITSSRTEFASFVPILLKNCPECDVYLLDYYWLRRLVNFKTIFPLFVDIPFAANHPVTLIGMSHGAARSIGRVGKVVALAPYESIHKACAQKIMSRLPKWAEKFVKFAINVVLGFVSWPDPSRSIIDGNKLLLVHGDNDKLIPISHSKALYKTALQNKIKVELCRVEHAWHVPWQLWSNKKCLEKIFDLIKL